jgi:4-hydroxy-tetrahydrodipicolinate synthase
MVELEILCMTVTPMNDDHSVDEGALREQLRRLVSARNGVYLGSGGSGEGHALSVKELRRVYEIGVEEAGGKVPVYANPRESRTADDMYDVAREAVEAGVDMVQIYQLDAGHGMTPTVKEQEAYFTSILDRIDHPVAISVHVFAGYLAPVDLLTALSDRYPQIVALNVMGATDRYFSEIRDALPEAVRLFTSTASLPTLATLGAAGSLGAENNCIPNICRAVGDSITSGDQQALADAMTALHRFSRVVAEVCPHRGSARGNKMAMKALGLGNGVLRPPYLELPQSDQDTLRDRLADLRIAELEGLHRTA